MLESHEVSLNRGYMFGVSWPSDLLDRLNATNEELEIAIEFALTSVVAAAFLLLNLRKLVQAKELIRKEVSKAEFSF